MLNVLVALWALWLFREQLSSSAWLRMQAVVSFIVLAVGFAVAGQFTSFAEAQLYADEIVYTETTPYQRIVVTRWKDDLRLFLNNNLQFSARDEYRYHEALVHPGLATLPGARRVLILGGGDGLAAREILKYPQIESVTLVDLDPAMTRLFSTAAPLRKLNADSLRSPRIKVVNEDALKWLEENDDSYDFVVVDFPDPSNFAIGKLYSAAFYRLLEKHMTPAALAVIQSTSPLYARQSFWCVATTLESVGFVATPYHALVPSFGEWGFVLAGRHVYKEPASYPVETRFLTPRNNTDAVPVSQGYGACRRRCESAEQSGPRSLLRERVAGKSSVKRMHRRDFIASLAAAGLASVAGCAVPTKSKLPPGELSGTSMELGHRLREGDFPQPSANATDSGTDRRSRHRRPVGRLETGQIGFQ